MSEMPLPTESTCDGFLVQSQAQAALHSQWKQEQKEARARAKLAELNSFFGEVTKDEELEREERRERREKRERKHNNKKRRYEGTEEKGEHGGLGAFFKKSMQKFRKTATASIYSSSSNESHIDINHTTSTTGSIEKPYERDVSADNIGIANTVARLVHDKEQL